MQISSVADFTSTAWHFAITIAYNAHSICVCAVNCMLNKFTVAIYTFTAPSAYRLARASKLDEYISHIQYLDLVYISIAYL